MSVTPSDKPRHDLGEALEAYAELLNPSHPQNLEKIARVTIEISKLAQSVMHATSPTLRTIGTDVEHLLQSPYSVPTMDQDVSILKASEHYLENPSTAELGPLIQELRHNPNALVVMCNELTLLSGAIKNPIGPAN